VEPKESRLMMLIAWRGLIRKMKQLLLLVERTSTSYSVEEESKVHLKERQARMMTKTSNQR